MHPGGGLRGPGASPGLKVSSLHDLGSQNCEPSNTNTRQSQTFPADSGQTGCTRSHQNNLHLTSQGSSQPAPQQGMVRNTQTLALCPAATCSHPSGQTLGASQTPPLPKSLMPESFY